MDRPELPSKQSHGDVRSLYLAADTNKASSPPRTAAFYDRNGKSSERNKFQCIDNPQWLISKVSAGGNGHSEGRQTTSEGYPGQLFNERGEPISREDLWKYLQPLSEVTLVETPMVLNSDRRSAGASGPEDIIRGKWGAGAREQGRLDRERARLGPLEHVEGLIKKGAAAPKHG